MGTLGDCNGRSGRYTRKCRRSCLFNLDVQETSVGGMSLCINCLQQPPELSGGALNACLFVVSSSQLFLLNVSKDIEKNK
jgi:hypothetical protein